MALKTFRAFTKDGINDYLVHNNHSAINTNAFGTKAAANYDITVKARSSVTLRFRLEQIISAHPFEDFDKIFAKRLREADEFYEDIQAGIETDDEKLVQRQAFAGMLWSKQFYYYDVEQWLREIRSNLHHHQNARMSVTITGGI